MIIKEKDLIAAIKVACDIIETEEFELKIANKFKTDVFMLKNFAGLANLGDIESETFCDLAGVIDRLDSYHEAYFLEANCDKKYDVFGEELIDEKSLPYIMFLESDFCTNLLSTITPWAYSKLKGEEFQGDPLKYLLYKDIANKIISNQSAYTMIEKDDMIYLSNYGYEGDESTLFVDIVVGNSDSYQIYEDYQKLVEAETQQILSDLSDLGTKDHYLSSHEFEYLGLNQNYLKVKNDEVNKTGDDLIKMIDNLPFTQKDKIYRHLWTEYVEKDFVSQIKSLELPYTVEEGDIEQMAYLYVYEGRYDCNLSYWDNIDNIIENVLNLNY